MTPATAVAVLLGGAVGTALRAGLDLVLPHGETGFPLSTLLANVLGSFLLALAVARLWPRASPWLRAGLGTGLLGSFTTFSALAVSLTAMTQAGLVPLAVGYLVLSLAAGFAAAALGLRLGRGPEPLEADE